LKRFISYLPILTTVLIAALMIIHGPIAQLAHYHDFADQRSILHIPHAADVLSNIGFAVVAVWGMVRLWPQRDHHALRAGWHGYVLFLTGLLLTAFGSSIYHWAPDNARLVWDRLPIAFACAGLLSAVRAESLGKQDSKLDAMLLAMFAIISIAWWYITELYGAGDLRPYLLLQGLPLILIPMWQAIYRADKVDRIAFGIALLLYIVAKAVELYDHQLLAMLGAISGHTLKHVLATMAAGVLVARLVQRTRSA
jgi:hypothetical protein